MDRHLFNAIITEGSSINACVNTSLLNGNKRNFYQLSYLEIMPWKDIRHLHFLGSQDHESIRQLNTSKLSVGCHVNPREGWAMVIGASVDQIRTSILAARHLELLDVRFTDVESLEVGHLSKLLNLQLSENGKLERVNGLAQLNILTHLNLRNTALSWELDVDDLPRLEHLEIRKTNIKRIICTRKHRALKTFIAAESELLGFQFLEHFINLRHLDLSGCANFKYIHESIRDLNRLETLLLKDLELEELPDWIPEKDMTIGMSYTSDICLKGTKIKNTDMSIFSEDNETIRNWLKDLKTEHEQPLNELKIVFLGDGGSGKSHTIERIMLDGKKITPKEFSGDATPGVLIKDKIWDINGRQVTIHIWDFGGQEILHSMHRIFLTEQTLYVVLVDARNDMRDEQAKYWLNNIASVSDTAPVILALNKIDQNPNASIDIEGMKFKYPNLKHVLSMSALEDSQEKFSSELMSKLEEEIISCEVLDYVWPASWMRLKKRLQNMESPYISKDQYENFCREYSVDEGQRGVLEYFRNLGISFFWEDRRTEDYVVLRPGWITNAVYTILFNKRDEVENGMITHKEIIELLAPDANTQREVKRVSSTEEYRWRDIEYILNVVRRFQLSYRVDEETEFFPMLCKRNSKPVLIKYMQRNDTLEFHMEFQYLPQSILHRLMVYHYNELDINNIWLTGAHFVQPELELGSVVVIDENTLKLYVKKEGNRLASANTYMSMLKCSIEKICADMRLPAPRNYLLYKENNQKDRFDYNRLIAMLDRNYMEEYSTVFGRMLKIEDILTQSAPIPTDDPRQLIEDLLQVCGQMQSVVNYQSFDENDRNTVVRNGLELRGYTVHDQRLAGHGKQKKRPGELDFDIRRYAQTPWTICEALRVSGVNKTIWNEHLEKLLTSYNTNGSKFLVLLSYVDCTDDLGFISIYNGFDAHIRSYKPSCVCSEPIGVETITDGGFANYSYIRAMKCTYDINGYMPDVYYLFVRFG